MDTTQQHLTDYAHDLRLEDLAPTTIQAAKEGTILALGAVLGGFAGEPCRIARAMAGRMRQPDGATVIGTHVRTSPDMAAFVNGTAAGSLAVDDTRRFGASLSVVMPALAAAEHVQAGGRDLIVAAALGEAVFRRLADSVGHGFAFCASNLTCIASALAAGKVMGLSREQLAQSVGLAAVTSVTLDQIEDGEPSMWNAFSAGHAGRAGLFAALTARQGMEGPARPFEGKTGWCDLVAGSRSIFDRPDDATDHAINPATQVETRFLSLTEAVLGAARARAALDHIRNMETLDDVGTIPAALVIA